MDASCNAVEGSCREPKPSNRKSPQIKTSITDQWKDFPHFVIQSGKTLKDNCSEECRCPGPTHRRSCRCFDYGNLSKPISPIMYWKTVEGNLKERGPNSKAPEKVENCYSLEAVRARALADGEIDDEEDFYDDYSDYMADFGVTPESDLSHMDPFMAAMLRDMWRHDGRLPKAPTRCNICSEGHHHKRCPFYLAFGKKTKNRYQTAVDYYNRCMEDLRNAEQPRQ